MSTVYQTSDSRVETYAGCSAAGLLISQRNGEVDGQTDGHQTNAYKRVERNNNCQYSLHFWLICYLDMLGIISHSGLCHTTFATFSNVFTCAMLCIHSTSHWPVSVCLSVTSRSCAKRAERIGLVFDMWASFRPSYTVLKGNSVISKILNSGLRKFRRQRPLHVALRVRGHDFQLPNCIYKFHKQSFIVSSLFRFLK